MDGGTHYVSGPGGETEESMHEERMRNKYAPKQIVVIAWEEEYVSGHGQTDKHLIVREDVPVFFDTGAAKTWLDHRISLNNRPGTPWLSSTGITLLTIQLMQTGTPAWFESLGLTPEKLKELHRRAGNL